MLETDEELSLSESESDESELLDDEDLKIYKLYIFYSKALFAAKIINNLKIHIDSPCTYLGSLILRTFIFIKKSCSADSTTNSETTTIPIRLFLAKK